MYPHLYCGIWADTLTQLIEKNSWQQTVMSASVLMTLRCLLLADTTFRSALYIFMPRMYLRIHILTVDINPFGISCSREPNEINFARLQSLWLDASARGLRKAVSRILGPS